MKLSRHIKINAVNHGFFFTFPASSYALEYIVVVEINVSEVILIEQLKSFSLQLDNTTKISSVNVTTGKFGIHCPFYKQYTQQTESEKPKHDDEKQRGLILCRIKNTHCLWANVLQLP